MITISLEEYVLYITIIIFQIDEHLIVKSSKFNQIEIQSDHYFIIVTYLKLIYENLHNVEMS